ncbi:MAG: hypothetical protein AAGF11_10695 [Myxococcota bacterium]
MVLVRQSQLILSLAVALMLLPVLARASESSGPSEPGEADGEDLVLSAEERAAADAEAEAEAIERERRFELYDRGSESYDAGDYAGAIEPWQELYDTIPLRDKTDLFTQLADAHWKAYQTDQEQEHLDQAKAMLERNLEHTYGDEDAQRQTQEQLDAVEAELQRLEDARVQRKLEEAERTAVAREQARRRQEDLEQRKAKLDEKRRRFGVRVKVGGSLAGVGVASLVTAVVGMGLGEGVDRDGLAFDDDPDVSEEEVLVLERRGRAYNQLAVVTGAIGGALAISGVTVIVVASLRLRRATGEVQAQAPAQARVVPGILGVEVRF